MDKNILNVANFKLGPLPHVWANSEILRDAQTTLVRALNGEADAKSRVTVEDYDVFMVYSADWIDNFHPLWVVKFYQEGPSIRINNTQQFHDTVEKYRINNQGTRTVEASELGWAPGEFKTNFIYEGIQWRFYSRAVDREGDVQSWTFIGRGPSNVFDTLKLKVFND